MKFRVLVGLFLVIGVAGTLYWWMSNQGQNASSDSYLLYGNVDIREARLAFNGSEHVSEILVQEGDRVKAGQLIAKLHTDRLRAALDRSRAEVVATQAEAHAAELSYKRVKSMAARNLASSSERDEAEAKSRAAAARVAASKAALKETEQAFNDTELYAPFAGVVRERIVEVGDFVSPQTPIVTLAVLNPVWVRTYIPETYLGRIKPGAKVTVHTDSYPNNSYEGWVGSVSPTAEFTPKNIETPELRTRLVYQLRVFVCNPELELRLGMPATVNVALDQSIAAQDNYEKRCQDKESANP